MDRKYGMKEMGAMGHDKKPMKCDPFAAQKKDMGRVQYRMQTDRGYPRQAMQYKY